MTKLCFDIDCLIFDCVSVAEEKFITVTHRPTGKVMEFDNRTEFYGHHLKKNAGWLGVQNKMQGNEYYKAEDFDIVDGQRPRPFRTKLIDEHGNEVDGKMSPFDGAKKIIDDQIVAICKQLGVTEYFGFTGTGDVFRHDAATLLPYKGQREDTLRPLLLDRMKQYVCEHHNCELITGIEADDACSIATVAAYKAWKKSGDDADKVIQVRVDKDAKQTEGWHFNPKKDKEPHLIQGFGKLWLNDKGDVDGDGRMFLYWQIAHGDDTDGYKANCFSKVKYGGKGAYNDLKECKNDKEAFEALVRIFKKLYPEPIEVDGCKGRITIDWLHVCQEMATMAMMLRHPGDKMDVKATLVKLGIEH